jgi:hypothetical protein
VIMALLGHYDASDEEGSETCAAARRRHQHYFLKGKGNATC